MKGGMMEDMPVTKMLATSEDSRYFLFTYITIERPVYELAANSTGLPTPEGNALPPPGSDTGPTIKVPPGVVNALPNATNALPPDILLDAVKKSLSLQTVL
jgi:hypothetical protein